MRKLIRRLTVVAFAFWAEAVSAALISADLYTVGDGLLTRDTSTGLDWLDLTQTVSLSYNDVINGVGNTWIDDGFRYATIDEIDHFYKATGWDGGGGLSPLYYDMVLEIHGMWGVTAPGNGIYDYTYGITGTPFDPRFPTLGRRWSWAATNPTDSTGLFLSRTSRSGVSSDSSYSYAGSALIRLAPIPTPATLALFSIGLAGLGWSRRKKV